MDKILVASIETACETVLARRLAVHSARESVLKLKLQVMEAEEILKQMEEGARQSWSALTTAFDVKMNELKGGC